MNELATNNKNNQIIKPGEITKELYIRYINYLDVSPKTQETYKKALKQLYTYFNSHEITTPTRQDIVNFKNDLAKSHKPTTVNSYLSATRQFFQWLDQEGIYKDITTHIKNINVSKDFKKDYLTANQVKDILTSIDQGTSNGKRDYTLFLLIVTCGLRTIEVSRANIEDIRTVGNKTVLYVQGKGKTEKNDFIIIPGPLEKVIRSYLKDRRPGSNKEPLFISTSNNRKGDRLTTRSIRGIIKDILVNAGYDSERLTAHSLRHTAITLSLINGCTIQEAQQFARHSNINTTMIYAHNLEKLENNCSNSIIEMLGGEK